MIIASMLLLRLQGLSTFSDIGLLNCSSKVKSAAYKCIVRPVMEYVCPVWFLHTTKNINSLEHVQSRAARWASVSRWNPCSYSWSKSSDECITELKWPSIHQCHVYIFHLPSP